MGALAHDALELTIERTFATRLRLIIVAPPSGDAAKVPHLIVVRYGMNEHAAPCWRVAYIGRVQAFASLALYYMDDERPISLLFRLMKEYLKSLAIENRRDYFKLTFGGKSPALQLLISWIFIIANHKPRVHKRISMLLARGGRGLLKHFEVGIDVDHATLAIIPSSISSSLTSTAVGAAVTRISAREMKAAELYRHFQQRFQLDFSVALT